MTKKRSFLYLTEFFCGMSVMAVELGASRLLAPYFSSSQIVWTIIIAAIMIAMALGNVWGGRTADKDPDPDRLYGRLLIAAVWIAAVPVLGKYVILGITGLLVIAVNSNFLVIAALLACLVLFVFPCLLLGTCTPSLARYTVTGSEDSGRTVGMLGAFNTIGSIIGTFIPTFVTIPSVGTSATFLIFAVILFILSAVWFAGKKQRIRRLFVSSVLIAICVIFGARGSFAFWEDDLLYEGESVYNYLQVSEDDRSVVLSTNVLFGVQSILMKNGGLTGMYYDYALAAPVMAGCAEKDGGKSEILVLGMGTGTFASQCLSYFENPDVTGVEIDEKITELAKNYFRLSPDVRVYTYDGRAFLDADGNTYDVIIVDAYQDITIPFQMSSVEFFRAVKEHLKAGGVLTVNMNMRSDAPDGINAYLADTIASVFPYVVISDVPGGTNRELFASDQPIGSEVLEAAARNLGDETLKNLMKKEASLMKDYTGGGRILTDDKAPVELLGMKVIDGIISEEITYYKENYRELIRSFLRGDSSI